MWLREATLLGIRGRSLAALGLGYALRDLGVVDQGGYCRGSGRVLPLESNEHFLLGIL